MKKIKRILWLACFCLAFFLLAAGAACTRRGSDFLSGLTILSEEGFDSGLVDRAVGNGLNEGIEDEESEEEPFAFTAWTEYRNETVSDEFSKTACNADITAICGSSHCLLPFGKNLSAQDTKGCIIGSRIAEKLFGGKMAEGQEIIWRDRKWMVCGVVEEPADLLMVQVSGMKDEVIFHKISISLNGADDRKLTGEKFASRYGISAQSLRWDYLYSISWFKEMIPDKWSDFSGWKQNFKEYGEAVKYVQNTEKSTIEAEGLKEKRIGRRYFLLGFFCLVLMPFFCKKSFVTIRSM